VPGGYGDEFMEAMGAGRFFKTEFREVRRTREGIF
jgi:hypothetical protein